MSSKKPTPTWDQLIFFSPEQRVLRFLVSHPTSAFSPRVMASKLKGVRGLGGQEGLVKILGVLQEQGMVEFIDNGKEVRMNDEHPLLARLKSLVALCDLEDLLSKLRPVCTKAIFFGSRATGKAHSSSNYDLYVVTTDPAAAQLAVQGHPLAKDISLKAMTPEEDSALEKQDPKLASSLIQGMMLWGPSW